MGNSGSFQHFMKIFHFSSFENDLGFFSGGEIQKLKTIGMINLCLIFLTNLGAKL